MSDPTGMLESLLASYARLEAQQTIDIPIPGWAEPALALRVKSVSHATIKRAYARIAAARGVEKSARVEVDQHAAIVAHAVVGVLVDDANTVLSLTEGPIFELACQIAQLRERKSPEGGTDVILALAWAEGDVITLARRVVEHSGYSRRDIDEEFLGE